MKNSAEFNAGTIVKLKSGGPDMTIRNQVQNIDGKPTTNYKCLWFAGKKLEDGVFPYESLELVNPESRVA